MAARRTTKLAAGATVAPKLAASATAHLAARAAKLAAITTGLA